ncbi:insulinase family protein [Streptomyces sp. NPDC048428]|uniref:insulinase family protein n=1 Tax=Streptomyces sp. NPDC048428 TaxID=3154503 RepID=UPI0034171F45
MTAPPTVPPRPSRAVPPAASPVTPPAAPARLRTQLVPVHLPGRLTAVAHLVLHIGKTGGPPVPEASARVWAMLLRRGGGWYGGTSVEDGLEDLGTTLTVDVDRHAIRCVLRSTPELLADALALLARTVEAFAPTADEIDAFVSRWHRARTAVRRTHGDPSGSLLNAALFPPGEDPRTRDSTAQATDTPETIDAETVRALHRRVQNAPRDLVIAADLARVDLRALVRSAPAPARAPHSAPAPSDRPAYTPEPIGPPKALTVRRGAAGSPCVVMIGIRAPDGTGDLACLELARLLLTATPSSRLTRTLRESSGLAYAVHGDIVHEGPLSALRFRFEVPAEQAPQAAIEALDVVFGLATRAPCEEDLREAVQAHRWDGAGWGSPAAAASAGASRATPAAERPAGGGPLAGRRFTEVTPDDFLRAATELIEPERVAVVIDGAAGGADAVVAAVADAAWNRPGTSALAAYSRLVTASSAVRDDLNHGGLGKGAGDTSRQSRAGRRL